eukprot:12104793-Heterocapsa_arctica.AAC.1
MDRIVMHKGLTASRTCVPGTDYGSPADMSRMCQGKTCFTCQAFKITQVFKDETFDEKNSNIVKHPMDSASS